MRHEKDRFSASLELTELVEALVREGLIADSKHFVDEENVRVDVDRHRKPEPHVHAGRVSLHRCVDKILQLRKVDDLVEPSGDLTLRQAQHDAVDEHVLASGYLRMKTGSELDQR